MKVNLKDDFYTYVYIIVKNGVSICITDEDIEEIISDVFLAIWKNSNKLPEITVEKTYLVGITKNVVKNKYRNIRINFSISNYEENIINTCNIEEIVEQKEQDKIIQNTVHQLKDTEYKIFIMFYYESKTIKEIAKVLNLSTSNVKIIVPQNFKQTEIYKVYIRSNPDIRKYDLLHDYVFSYQKDEEHSIRYYYQQ